MLGGRQCGRVPLEGDKVGMTQYRGFQVRSEPWRRGSFRFFRSLSGFCIQLSRRRRRVLSASVECFSRFRFQTPVTPEHTLSSLPQRFPVSIQCVVVLNFQ